METATLNTTETTLHTAERDLRHALVRAWRANPRQGAAAHAAYAMIRGKSITQTFSPITNPDKLANGHAANGGRNNAIWAAKIGSQEAWGWAWNILIEHGVELDRFNRLDLGGHSILSQWRENAAQEIDLWR